ncbi:MAG: YicC/YloC family endoribonuclease [Sphaerochaetaceae bacterium]
MLSMTGYGYAETSNADYIMVLEIKSYNNRYLDINHNMPFFLSPFEIAVDNTIKQATSRGHVDLTVRVKQLTSLVELHIDENAVRRYAEAFQRIDAIAILGKKPDLRDFLAMDGVMVNVKENNAERYGKPLMELLDTALKQFTASKKREGEATRKDLVRLGDQFNAGLTEVKKHAGELEVRLKENLIARFEELLGQKGYDENRLLQEIAILLNKYSINEEIVRLDTHIMEFQKLLVQDEPVGKKLDFLSQEMNREINTIGSKSVIVEINQQVVYMKDSLENIREQIRNIE